MNQERLDVQAGFRKGRGTRDQIANICCVIEKAREFQKKVYFCFIDYSKAFDFWVNHRKLWRILKRWEYQTTVPASWETCMQDKKQQLEPDMDNRLFESVEKTCWVFKFEKEVHQGCILSTCLFNLNAEFSSVQLFSRVWLFATPWTTARQVSLSITNSWSVPKLMSIESVMPPNHLILCHPLLLLPSIFPRIRVFSNESVLHIRWPKYWSFSFNISPLNEHSGLISFTMDWLDLLAVQGTLKNLLQHHSSKHQFFGSQLSFWSNSHIHTWLLEKPQPWLDGLLLAK